MEQKQTLVHVIVSVFVVIAVLMVGAFLLPWKYISWGRIKFVPIETITVIGEARSQQKTQIASFSAGASAVGDDKQTAINEVNKKVEAIIESLKEFGIAAEDIKTQNLNVFQSEESYYEEGRQKSRPGQWRVNNSIEVKLRDVDKASALAGILTKSGATNVYGPNFSFDDTTNVENELIGEAFTKAREKADLVATASKRKIARVVNIAEGSQGAPILYRMDAGGAGGGGGGPVEPGSGTVYKTVTVTFELE